MLRACLAFGDFRLFHALDVRRRKLPRVAGVCVRHARVGRYSDRFQFSVGEQILHGGVRFLSRMDAGAFHLSVRSHGAEHLARIRHRGAVATFNDLLVYPARSKEQIKSPRSS